MKINRKRKYGFTLLEVIVSMAIISIISVSIYTIYIIMIDQTKRGEIKQATALEGKKVIESLQANNFKIQNTAITVDGMNFDKNGSQFIRYLNNEYKDKQDNGDSVTEDTAKYIESITLTPTKVTNSIDSNIDKLELENNNLNLVSDKIYISENNSKNYIEYSGISKEILVINNEKTQKNRMELYIYLTPNNSTIKYTEILDYRGERLLYFTENIDENLIINFDNYKEEGTLPSDTDICIYIYNKTLNTANVYLEMKKQLNVDLKICKGEINIYNNYINADENNGTLYDIKVEIIDKNKRNTLFTGYYKKNIHQ